MRGLELGFFDVTPSDGIIVYPTLGGETKKNFFDPRGAGNCREAVTQFAAITQLIEEYGYPVESVLGESVKKDQAARYALDALVFDGPQQDRGAVRVAMEAKIQVGQMKQLMCQLDKCCQKGLHDKYVHTLRGRADHATKGFSFGNPHTFGSSVQPSARPIPSGKSVTRASRSSRWTTSRSSINRPRRCVDAFAAASLGLVEALTLESNTRTNQAGIEFVQRPAMTMKKCPQCNRTYSDGSFSFCLGDGALLPPSYDSHRRGVGDR